MTLLLAAAATFNSLCEIPATASPRRSQLSPFNSLCEILITRFGFYNLMYIAFNSLCEIQLKAQVELIGLLLTFNSLCEIRRSAPGRLRLC